MSKRAFHVLDLGHIFPLPHRKLHPSQPAPPSASRPAPKQVSSRRTRLKTTHAAQTSYAPTMQTRYLTSITTHFNPLSSARPHKISRLLLSCLPTAAIAANGSPLPVKSVVLPRTSPDAARITIGFKGGETVEWVEVTRRRRGRDGKDGGAQADPVASMQGVIDLGKIGLKDVLEEVGRRCRLLSRKDQISG